MSYTVNVNFSGNGSVSISRKPDVFSKPVVSEERRAAKKMNITCADGRYVEILLNLSFGSRSLLFAASDLVLVLMSACF